MSSFTVSSTDVESFCRKWRVWDLTHASDSHARAADAGEETQLYVRFDPRAEWSLVDRIRMQEELRALLGKPVTLHMRHSAALRRTGNGSGTERRRSQVRLLYDA